MAVYARNRLDIPTVPLARVALFAKLGMGRRDVRNSAEQSLGLTEYVLRDLVDVHMREPDNHSFYHYNHYSFTRRGATRRSSFHIGFI